MSIVMTLSVENGKAQYYNTINWPLHIWGGFTEIIWQKVCLWLQTANLLKCFNVAFSAFVRDEVRCMQFTIREQEQKRKGEQKNEIKSQIK